MYVVFQQTHYSCVFYSNLSLFFASVFLVGVTIFLHWLLLHINIDVNVELVIIFELFVATWRLRVHQWLLISLPIVLSLAIVLLIVLLLVLIVIIRCRATLLILVGLLIHGIVISRLLIRLVILLVLSIGLSWPVLMIELFLLTTSSGIPLLFSFFLV